MSNVLYTAVISRGERGWVSAHVPDLPGCTATGRTFEEALYLVTTAAQRMVDDMRERGRPVPPARTEAVLIDAGG